MLPTVVSYKYQLLINEQQRTTSIPPVITEFDHSFESTPSPYQKQERKADLH